MILTKEELAKSVSWAAEISMHQARKLVHDFFETIQVSLVQGKEVHLYKIGVFVLQDKRPRRGRNPKTGEELMLAARRVVRFRVAKTFRAEIDQRTKRGDNGRIERNGIQESLQKASGEQGAGR